MTGIVDLTRRRGGVARLLDVVGASEWMAIHADAASGLAALTVSSPQRAV